MGLFLCFQKKKVFTTPSLCILVYKNNRVFTSNKGQHFYRDHNGFYIYFFILFFNIYFGVYKLAVAVAILPSAPILITVSQVICGADKYNSVQITKFYW